LLTSHQNKMINMALTEGSKKLASKSPNRNEDALTRTHLNG